MQRLLQTYCYSHSTPKDVLVEEGKSDWSPEWDHTDHAEAQGQSQINTSWHSYLNVFTSV